MEKKFINSYISKSKISLFFILILFQKVYNAENEITIFINETIGSQIINFNYNNSISKVVVNGKSSNIKDYYYLLNEGINEIIIKFNKELDTCVSMFYDLKNIVILDISNFYSSKVKTMSNMFYGCSSLISLDLSSLDTSSVTGMRSMFFGCSSLISLDLSSFDTSSVTDMGWMFRACSSLKSLDLSSFDTSYAIRMDSMFNLCFSLISLDLSSFNTSSVTDMRWMFYGCSSLISLDLSSFNTSSVTGMRSMFFGCSSLISLDLSSFNTASVTGMYSMFYGCSSLVSLDLSSFITSSVTDMYSMFYGCSSLISLYIDQFNVSSTKDMRYMFSECSSLISLNLSNFNNITYSHNITGLFTNCNSNLKYCINDNITYNYMLLDLLKYFHKNCSEICITYNKKKYISQKFLCINDCSSDAQYKFEYNNICYEEPKNNTTNDINNIEANDTTSNRNETEFIKVDNSEKKNSSGLIIGIICGGVGLIIIIVVLIVLYKKIWKNKINNICAPCESSTTQQKINSGPELIKVIFDDNETNYEINAIPENTMKDLIDNYCEKNNFQVYNKLFLCDKKNILTENINAKIKEFNNNNDDNIVVITVTENPDTQKEIITVIFDDNRTKYKINAEPEATMKNLIDRYYAENNIKIKNRLFLCGGKNILIDGINSKIKEFNKFNDDNIVTITVIENTIS